MFKLLLTFLISFAFLSCEPAFPATTVSFNNVNYSVPASGDENWGTSLSNYLIAISNYTLQPKGGNFTLLSDVDFGANYGIRSVYFKSKNANPASAGQIRLGNAEMIKWRNAANNADYGLSVNASNWLQYNAIDLADISSSQTLTNKTISGSANAISNIGYSSLSLSAGDIPYSKLSLSNSILNADINSSAGIVYSKLSLSNSILNADVNASAAIDLSKLAPLATAKVLQSNASTGLIEASSVSNTTLSYLDATSSVQTQINNQIPKSIVDAKGDIITASADNTPARLGVGSNNQVLTADSSEATGMKWATPASNPVTTKGDLAGYSTSAARVPVGSDGQVLTADSTAALGLSYQPSMAKNYIINSNFDIWQRGVTQITSTTSFNYFPDRFKIVNFTSGVTGIKIDKGTSAPPVGSTAYLRYRISANAATNVYLANVFHYRMESDDAKNLMGKTVTLSFLVKSSVTRTLNWTANGAGYTAFNNSTDGSAAFVGGPPNSGSLYSGVSSSLTANTWTRVSQTFTMSDSGTGSIANGFNLGIGCNYLTVGAETDSELQFAQVMLNEGSIAMPFQTAGANHADELALCERYYNTLRGFTGSGSGTTIVVISPNLSTSMRANPTITAPAGAINMTGYTQSSFAYTTYGWSGNSGQVKLLNFTGITQNASYYNNIEGSGTYLAFSAEL